MSSSPDVRARRAHLVAFDSGIATAVLPELAPRGARAVDVTDEPAVDASYDAGFADGHAAAVAGAVAAATAEARAQGAQAAQLAASLADAAALLRRCSGEELDAVSAGVAEAALQLAEAIVGRALAGEAPAAAAIARAMALVPSGEAAVVRLHPSDVDVVGPIERAELRVVADPAVRPGGCIVDAGASSIDGGIAAAVERARAALLGEEDASW